MSDDYFTLVFKGSLRGFAGNPLKTDTPFGMPFAAGIGDAFEKIGELEERLEVYREIARSITEVLPEDKKTL